MTEQEVKDVVTKTINELLDQGRILEDDNLVYQYTSVRLSRHYHNRQDRAVTEALEKLKDDPYFRVIPDYYDKLHTLQWIAVDIGCDRVTVVRNKKRLVLKLYTML